MVRLATEGTVNIAFLTVGGDLKDARGISQKSEIDNLLIGISYDDHHVVMLIIGHQGLCSSLKNFLAEFCGMNAVKENPSVFAPWISRTHHMTSSYWTLIL